MFIALTGLHCSGKSYFTDNLPSTYGYTIAKKNQLLEGIFKSDENLKSSFESSNIWYNHKFESNPYKITAMIIEKIYMNKNIILDSVHSNLEWEIIKFLLPDAKLIEFISPKSLRENRWDSNYKLSDKDKLRINYWHNCKASSLCLISEVD